MRLTVGILVGLLPIAPVASARTWYIIPDGTGDAPTIQEGINQSVSGDSILIECGTYQEGSITLREGRTLVSASGQPDCVILDGQGVTRVFRSANYSNPSGLPPAVLVGLTVANGWTTGPSPNHVGGGLYSEDLSVEAYDCVFATNSSSGSGGAVFLGQVDGRFERCVFVGNSSTGGGALMLQNSPTVIRECSFVANSAVNTGGAIYEGYAYPLIDQCTFVGNSAGLEGSAIYTSSTLGTTTIARSIIVGGVGAEPVTCYGDVILEISCTDILDNEAGDWVGCLSPHAGINGNFSEDPLFCAPQDAQFTLRSNSPCAPENSNGCGLIGALPVACGPVSVEEWSWGRIKDGYRPKEPAR